MSAADDLTLFPTTASINPEGHLSIAGHDLSDLAAQYGTPFYLYDGTTIRTQLECLRGWLDHYFPGKSAVAYASKAYYSRAFAGKLAGLDAGLDLTSLGEMQMARTAGFPPEVIHLHGNNKTAEELEAAIRWDIRAIVVDSLDELAILENLAQKLGRKARIWLRVTPDLSVTTHPHITTSHPGSKFGLHMQNGEAAAGIRQAMNSPWLNLTGLHTHLGSQLFDPDPYREAVSMLIDLADAEGFVPEVICPGGGWGVRYTLDDPPDGAETWVKIVSEALQEGCARLGWQVPSLVLEPGRWLVAQAGVAVYTVGSQKVLPDGTRILAVDGGLADNPRVALYGARYTARVVEQAEAAPITPTRVVGRYCESGDVLIPGVMLPEVSRGDLLAVPVSGAYQLSMASNYNFVPRPTVLWLEEDTVEVMQQREDLVQHGWWIDRP